MKMQITRKNILEYAEKYNPKYRGTDGSKVEKEMKRLLNKQRYISRRDLIKIGRWKSKRPSRYYRKNDDLMVIEVTKFSFSTISERARIESLLMLRGIKWPVASAILHFAFPNKSLSE
jgi:hypothetical protein